MSAKLARPLALGAVLTIPALFLRLSGVHVAAPLSLVTFGALPTSYCLSLATLVLLWASGMAMRAWLKPATVTRRFTRMCAGLGYDIHLHQLRHYSATELI